YHLLGDNIEDYAHNINSSRGCPYHCHYCVEGALFHGIRRKTPSQVVDELSYLDSRLPPDAQVFMNDSTYLIDSEWTAELCRRIRQAKISLSITCNLRPETVTPEMIREIQQSHFSRVCVGFEDGNDNIRRKSGKTCSFDELCKACAVIRRNGNLIINAYWMTGLPGSTLSSVTENIQKADFLIRDNLVDDIHNKIFVPYPGTTVYDTPQRFDLAILTEDWSKYDRLSLPVYRLKGMSEQQIYRAFWRMEVGLIASLMKREGVCGEDLAEFASKPYFRYIVDNYIEQAG
ncbi:MAG: radical SAM protein, partial [Candidatus Micrarchaeaceae archaeon]